MHMQFGYFNTASFSVTMLRINLCIEHNPRLNTTQLSFVSWTYVLVLFVPFNLSCFDKKYRQKMLPTEERQPSFYIISLPKDQKPTPQIQRSPEPIGSQPFDRRMVRNKSAAVERVNTSKAGDSLCGPRQWGLRRRTSIDPYMTRKWPAEVQQPPPKPISTPGVRPIRDITKDM